MEYIIIFGAGTVGRRLKLELEETERYKVMYYCDNDSDKQGQYFEDVEVLSFDKFVKICKELDEMKVIISIFDSESIVKQIRESGIIVNLCGLSWAYYQRGLYKNSKIDLEIYSIDYKKPRLLYYEYHVVDHCNLKCKGCGHYSNVVKEKFACLEGYENDIKRLKELFWGVKTIRLMGGEPLLNQDLPKFIKVTRNIFPDANIKVVSNGLLIPDISQLVFDVMYENRVEFDVTLYPPTMKLIDTIGKRCEENKIICNFSSPVKSFLYIYSKDGNVEAKETHAKCISRKSYFLREGKLSICPLPILDKEYGFGCGDLVKDEDIIDIYEITDGFMCNEILSKPINRCKYCDNINIKYFDWQGNFTYLLEDYNIYEEETNE